MLKNRKISKERFLEIILFIYIVLIISSNVMALKVVHIFGATMDAGTLTYPATFMIGDILAEIYGFKTAKKVIFLGFFANALFTVFTFLGTRLSPLDTSDSLTLGYDSLFSYSPRILISSFAAYILGSLINAYSLTAIKKLTGEKRVWIRTIGSTALGAAADTVIFSALAWGGTMNSHDILIMIRDSYIIKMIYEIVIATPLDYAVIPFTRKYVS